MATLDEILEARQERIDALHPLRPGRSALLVIDKFYGTPLDLALRSRDVRDLIVTGVVTDVCVNCTVLSAANRDYHVTVATDGVATLWPELQDACFAIWRRKFARLRDTDEVIEEIRGGSSE